jgi:hypothetical protein
MLRCRRRTNPSPESPRCDWTAYYDPMEDNGISFYSQKYQCSLATTFRSLPEPDSSQRNDTVLRILNLKLEASCTTSANEASSRLFLVDSTTATIIPAVANGALQGRKFDIINSGYFWRTVDYLAARHRLGHFRRYHSHLQEFETTISDIEGDTRSLDLSKPDILTCSLYLSVWLINSLVQRRLLGEAKKSLRGLPACSQLRGFFVLFHLCSYYMMGLKMMYSSRAVGIISLYSLTEYVIYRL